MNVFLLICVHKNVYIKLLKAHPPIHCGLTKLVRSKIMARNRERNEIS